MKLTIERLQEGYLVTNDEPVTMPPYWRKAKPDMAAVAREVLDWLGYLPCTTTLVQEILESVVLTK